MGSAKLASCEGQRGQAAGVVGPTPVAVLLGTGRPKGTIEVPPPLKCVSDLFTSTIIFARFTLMVNTFLLLK